MYARFRAPGKSQDASAAEEETDRGGGSTRRVTHSSVKVNAIGKRAATLQNGDPRRGTSGWVVLAA
jgi:hypothetical protein